MQNQSNQNTHNISNNGNLERADGGKSIQEYGRKIDGQQKKHDRYTNNDEDSLNNQIRSGQYFFNARKWFVHKYLAPSTERIYAGVMAIGIALTASMITHTAKISSDITQIPFALYSSPLAEDQYRIIPLLQDDLNVDCEVATYLLSHYVKIRETYLPYYATNEGYQKLFEQVKAISSDQVLDRFSTSMNINSNPNSPIIRYKFSISRNIEIQGVKFMPYQERPNAAIVKYSAKEIKNGTLISEYNGRIKVFFSIGNVENMNLYKNGYPFLVYGYEYIVD